MLETLRNLRALAVIPAFVWLFTQLAMPVLFVPPAAAGGTVPSGYAQSDLIEIVICTPSGFRTVKITPDGEIPEEDHAFNHCRWCQSFGNTTVDPQVRTDADPVTFSVSVVRWTETPSTRPKTAKHWHFQGRAPPA